MSLRTIGRQAEPSECVKARKAGAWRGAPRILAVLGFAAALGGCAPVESLQPFFDPKDVVLDSDLEGTWEGRIADAYSTLRFQGERDNTDGYRVELVFHGDQAKEDEPKEGTITFSVHLFQVGNSRFADFYPLSYSAKFDAGTIALEAEDNFFSVPTHTVYRVKAGRSYLQLAWLDDAKVKDFIEKYNLPLASDGTHLVLVGKTEELKARLLLQAEKEDLLDTDKLEFTREE